MKLSIIIPTYNSAQTIRRCLDSIVSQSFQDWEVLVMDGVSKDNTVELVKSYQEPRIKVYSEPDKGIYDAMNKGIQKAQGEWLYFLGSDDSFCNSSVLSNVFSIEGLDAYSIFYGDVTGDLDCRYRGEWNISAIEFNRCHQAIFYQKQLLLNYGGYDVRYKMLADYAINLRWFFDKSVTALYIPVNIANYSINGLSARTRDVTFYKDYGLMMLCYGHHEMSIKQCKNFARIHMMYNSEKKLVCWLLNMYVYCLRIVEKFSV